MRRFAALMVVLTISSEQAWAHGAEELGHHWDVPAYRSEMLIQIGLMVGTCLAVIAGTVIRNALSRGKESK